MLDADEIEARKDFYKTNGMDMDEDGWNAKVALATLTVSAGMSLIITAVILAITVI